MSVDKRELLQHLIAELSDEEPKGFGFDELVLRQDAALERLHSQLSQEPPEVIAGALGEALGHGLHGWGQLKLLELCDRSPHLELAEPLMAFARARVDSTVARERFLAGRACEVLVKLPLNLDARARANELSKLLLPEVQSAKERAQRERSMHRPRRIEWGILAAMMATGLFGLWFALQALD
jgi:hypothetical protein